MITKPYIIGMTTWNNQFKRASPDFVCYARHNITLGIVSYIALQRLSQSHPKTATSQTLAKGPSWEQNCSTKAAISSAVVSSVIHSSNKVTYNASSSPPSSSPSSSSPSPSFGLTRSMQISQSSPSPESFGLAGGEQVSRRKNKGKSFFILLGIDCPGFCLLVNCRLRYTPVETQLIWQVEHKQEDAFKH